MAKKPSYENLEKRIRELENAEHEREQTEFALHRRLEFEQLVKEISSEFAGVGGGNSIDSAINRALSSVGTFTGADRAYIFSFKNVAVRGDNTHEWCAEDIKPQIDNLKDIPIDEELPWFTKHIRNHEVFHVPKVAALPHEALLERKHFEAQNIQSLIVVPMETTERLIGFLGFDAVTKSRTWSEDDKDILQFLAQTLSHVIERKMVEDALRESEEKFRALAENQHDVVWTVNEKLEVDYISPSCFKMTGTTAEETMGMNPKEFYTEESYQRVIMKLAEERQKASNEMQSAVLEVDQYHEDGHLFPVEITCMPIIVDNKFIGVQGITRDITERKKAEKALQESEAQKGAILDGITTNLAFVNENLEVLWANKVAADSINCTTDEVIGRKCHELWADPEAPCVNCPTIKAFKTQKSEQTIIRTPDGNVWDEKGEPVFDDNGKLMGVLEIAHDITKRVNAEEALRASEKSLARSRKMESLGLMAGGIAHDLNNILSGIVTYPELLLMDLPEDSPLRKPIKTIQESGMRAADVVADLLTIARGVATGKEILNLNTIVTEYLGSPEHEELEKTHSFVDFKTELNSELLNMSSSPTHIKKTLMNLVINASEAIEGSGTVTISTVNRYLDEPLKGYEDVRQGEYVVLSVSDEGKGISPEDLEKIFEPFYTKKIMGRSGTGLGLAVVWNTVQDHNGYISLKSGDSGTVFELYFPVTRKEVSNGKEELPLENYLGHGEKILVVDDEERQREIAGVLLTKLGYVPEAVESGEEAIEYIKENAVDLIVLDMVMPKGINGRKTYEEIIKIHPGQKAIIASGYAKTKEVDIAQELGAGKYIKKPYTLAKVGVAVKEELAAGLKAK